MRAAEEMLADYMAEHPEQTHVSWALDGVLNVPGHGPVGMWEIGPCPCKRNDVHPREDRVD